MSILAPAPRAPWIFAALLLVLGVVLAVGGGQLVLLGGSSYYVLCGSALIAAAVALWRARRLGMWIYLAILGYTVIWSLYEVGLDGWSLASRLGMLLVLGVFFAFPGVRRRLA